MKHTLLILLVTLIGFSSTGKSILRNSDYAEGKGSAPIEQLLKQQGPDSDMEVLLSNEGIDDQNETIRLQQINASLRVVVFIEMLVSLIVFMAFAVDFVKSSRPVFSRQENTPFKFS